MSTSSTDVQSIVVRLVTEADVPAVQAKSGVEPSRARTRFDRMADGDYFYIAAFDVDGTPLGTAVLDTRPGDIVPELANMYVFPEARRRGVGRALSRWIEEKARDLGYDEVFLAVDPDNEQAIPLYISLGYSPTGSHRTTDEEAADAGRLVASHDAIYRKSLRYAV